MTDPAAYPFRNNPPQIAFVCADTGPHASGRCVGL